MSVVRYTAEQVQALGRLSIGPLQVDKAGATVDGRISRMTLTCLRSRGLVGLLAIPDGRAAVLTPKGREALGIGEMRL